MNIKKTNIILTFAVTLFLVLPMHQTFAHEAHCEIKDTQLGNIMKYMKSELRAYTKSVKSGDKIKMQKHLNELLMLSKQASEQMPVVINHTKHSVKEVEEKEYLKLMKELHHTFEILNETENESDIKLILKDIKNQKNIGHKEFRQDC